MPQLVKGGKYIFGWSKIGPNGEIRIPNEAYLEYGFSNDKIGILMSGSKRSGGFGLSSFRLLTKSPLKKILESFPELFNLQLKEGEIITVKNRNFCWIKIHKAQLIIIPQATLKKFTVRINDKLLVGRGSGLALAFIAKGPIFEEAKSHLEIPNFY